jgi:aminopeptidase YwaD
MNRTLACAVVAVIAALCLTPIFTQEREDRTLLDWDQMRAIINEVSGERALHYTMDLVAYPRVRTRAEYDGHFQESVVMERLAREFGFKNVEIESFPSMFGSWWGSAGELWMIAPESRKLYDIYDVAVSLCSGSESADVTADVVDVGIGGRPEDYAGKVVQGKIVLGSAGANVLQRIAVFERGAAGVLSYNTLRPSDSYPDQMLSQQIANAGPQGKKAGFGWSISASRSITAPAITSST